MTDVRRRRFAIEGTRRALQADRVTAEVAERFATAGIRSILLKGPSLHAWLYRDGAPRPYGDSDLLVAAASVPIAERILAELGFRQYLSDDDTPGWVQHAHHWERPARQEDVDIHYTLPGVGVSPQALWERLSQLTVRQRVSRAEVEVLDIPARAFHVALHAAQHGVSGSQSLDDLRRALAVGDEATWRSASKIAEELEALPAFVTGLSLLPAGDALVTELGLPRVSTAETRLLAGTQPPVSIVWEYLAQAPGFRARAAIVARKLVPSRRFMRSWSPLAQRGSLGLALAYALRPFWLIAKVGPGFLAWRRARRGL